jgi:hypothetical protein
LQERGQDEMSPFDRSSNATHFGFRLW